MPRKKGSKNKPKPKVAKSPDNSGTTREVGTNNFPLVSEEPGGQVSYQGMEGTVVTKEGNTEGKGATDEQLLKAGIKSSERPHPQDSNTGTSRTEGEAPVPQNKKKDIFNRVPGIKSEHRSMSHSGTIVTKLT